MRIAIAGLWHETNTFSTVPADRAAFEADALLHGEQIIAEYAGSQATIAGFLDAAKAQGFEPVPLVHARTGPIGLITQAAFESIVGEIIASLQAQGPWDGVLLANHGAAVAAGCSDADTEIARRVRAVVGPAVPIGMALDLHANLSSRLLHYTDVITVYQTNPHLDARDRGEHCAELLCRSIRGEIQPVQWLETPPLVINITRQATAEQPMRGIIETAAHFAAEPGMLSTSAVQGYPYADVRELGMSFLAIADGNRSMARACAQSMARQAWEQRHEMLSQVVSPADAIDLAGRIGRTGKGPVLLLDAGDNILGGSSADSTVLLAEARRQGVSGIFQTLFDPGAVEACEQAGPGSRVQVTVGAKTDTLHGQPLEISGEILAIADGQYEDTGPTHGGFRFFDDGRRALVRSDDGFTLLLTTFRSSNISRQQMLSIGLAPATFPIIIAKGVVSPRATYESLVGQIIIADTPGLTSANLAAFTYQHRRRPLFPFETDATYETP